jgi:hypothetical protein
MPVDGLDKILANLTKKEADLKKTVFVGMKYALKETVNYGKVAYSRPKTGKGFTDRTTNLRNSWSSTVMIDGMNVIGYVHAGWGSQPDVNYPYHVETRWDGKYAYLYPSVMDKKEYIFDTIKTLCQGVFT